MHSPSHYYRYRPSIHSPRIILTPYGILHFTVRKTIDALTHARS